MKTDEYMDAWNADQAEPQKVTNKADQSAADDEYVKAHDALDDADEKQAAAAGPVAEAVAQAKAPAAKPAVVSKAELEAFQKKYGADKTLTDYMNMQRGLTSRKDPTAGNAKNAADQAAADRIDPGRDQRTPRDAMQQASNALRNAEAGKSRGSRMVPPKPVGGPR